MASRTDRTHKAAASNLRAAEILTTPVDGYVTVRLGLGEVDLSVVRGYSPAVGDMALVSIQGASGYVLGALGDSAAVGTNDWEVPSAPDYGSSVLIPTRARTWRAGAWREPDPSVLTDLYQGDLTGTGVNFGVSFYGFAGGDLGDVTATGLAVTVERLPGGPPEPAAATFKLLGPYADTDPATLVLDSYVGPLLSVGRVQTVDLPPAWADAFVDRSAEGVGIYVPTDTPYVRLAGSRMELRLDWRA